MMKEEKLHTRFGTVTLRGIGELSPPATQRALATVLAVKHRHTWGFFAARRYAERRGSTPLLWMICLRLECERDLRSFPGR